ncbi:DUF637 domain-containing protein [Jinshanibacter sp. LJY008]|uniref:DUF637 domain-containing protein n=2 Tax=Limnobaculum eriocheiris TaxID=2897391 RepID=A0A9X1SKY0_9GAMM|nr:DUF637 domain-containing protein [Limnobaculum eriocheiris]MCD1126441.1 DUF637 domain-containing protein [Limnobaculum eriocheiris]
MYANRIRLVSTEQGVGVNTGNLIARSGDIQISAEGKVTIHGGSSATNSLNAQANEIQVIHSATLSGNNLNLKAKNITQDAGSRSLAKSNASYQADNINLNGELVSEQNLQINARKLTTSTNAAINAKTSTINADENNWSGALMADEAYFQGQTLNLAPQGVLWGKQTLTLNTSLALNQQGSLLAGDLLNLTTPQWNSLNGLTATGVSATGELQNGGILNIQAADTRLNNTHLSAGQINLTGKNLFQDEKSVFNAQNNLTLNASHLELHGKSLSNGSLKLQGDKLTAGSNAKMSAQDSRWNLTDNIDWLGQASFNTLNVNALNLSNSDLIQSSGSSLFTVNQLVNNAGAQLYSGELVVYSPELYNMGLIQTTGAGQFTLNQFTNDTGAQLYANELTIDALMLNNQGLIQSTSDSWLTLDQLTNGFAAQLNAGSFTLIASQLNNQGSLQSTGETVLTLNQLTNQANAEIYASDLFLSTATLNNGGKITGRRYLDIFLNSAGSNLNSGEIAGEVVTLQSQGVFENHGILFGASELRLNAQNGQIINSQEAGLYSGGLLDLTANALLQQGNILADGDITLALSGTGPFDQQGTIASRESLLWLKTHGAINNQGVLYGHLLDLETPDALTNQGKISGDVISLTTGGVLSNQNNATITASNLITGSAQSITQQGKIQSGGSIDLTSRSQIDNTGFIGSLNDLFLKADSGLSNTNDAFLYSGRDMYLCANQVSNLLSNILAGRHLTIQKDYQGNKSAEIVNRSGVIETQTGDITLKADHIRNESDGGSAQQNKENFSIPGNGAVVIELHKDQPNTPLTKVDCFNNGGTGGGSAAGRCALFPKYDKDYTLTGLISRTTVNLPALVNAAKIVAGRNLNIDAGVIDNNLSRLLAANDVNITANTLNNISTKQGVTEEYYVYQFVEPKYADYIPASEFYKDGGSLKYARSANNVVSSEGEEYFATVEAGRIVNLNVQNEVRNESIKSYSMQIAPTLSAPAGLDNLDPRSGIENTIPDAIPTVNGFPLPAGNNGLFVWNLDPDSPYLITANPALGELGYLSQGGRASQIAGFSVLDRLMGRQPGFGPPHETGTQWTDINQYLGSAYFLNQLGLQPESRYRFLGDARYDTRYITDAILRQTGQRYIGGVGSDLNQMRWLIDNAAQASSSLGLAFGVSLSEKQIAQLSHSIVWWEPVTINGQSVLAPKLYLVAADKSNVSGSVISAQHVAITAGDINNDGGTIKADGMLHLVSHDALVNREGIIQAGDNLTIIAKNDIQNLSGTIEGRNVTLQSVDGNVVNQTLHQQTYINADGSESDQNANTALAFGVTGITAGIHAKENLGIAAGKDIQITGAELSAGQNITLNAGENIDITANETLNLRTGFTTTQGDHLLDVHQQKSHINAADGAVTLTAGDSINVIASNINANDNITLQAKEDIAILSARDQTSRTIDGKLQHATTDVQSSDIQSGHNLIINAGNDIVMQASTLNAKDNALLVAGNDLTLLSDAESSYDRTNIKDGYKIEQTITQQSTEINAGNNVLIGAGNDATLQATQINAGGDIRLQAEGDLRLLTAEESDYYYEKTKTGGFLSSQSYEEESYRTTHKISELNAGNNIAITSGGDSLYQATRLNAGNDIALTSTGGQIQFSAVENTDFLKVDSKSSSVITRVAGHGHNNTTQQFSEITQGGELTIQAEKGIRADIRQSSAQSLTTALEQMESTPETAWVAELAVRNDVEWRAVQDAYDKWEYDSKSLSPAAAAVIAIVVTVVTAGAGAAAGTATASAVSAATAAAVQTLAVQASISLINNQGDVGKVLKDLGSKDNVKSLAASVVAAGVIAGVDTQMGWSQGGEAASASYTPGSTAEQIATVTPVSQSGFDTWWTGNSQLSSWDIAQRTVMHSGISAGVDSAINGSNFLESFGTSLMFNAGNELGRASSWYIGENAALFGGDGSFGKSVIHGLNGGLIAELTGGDFAAGAGAGFATELASGLLVILR